MAQRWEYAFLRWKGDGVGQHRSIEFSHRPDMDKLKGEMSDMVKRLADEGWEMFAANQEYNALTKAFTPVYVFKHPLTD